jgi:hypothetical protein
MILQIYLTNITCNPKKGEVNVDGRYTYHHHAGNDKSIGSKEFTKKKRKSMMELKKCTESASKKTKRDSNKQVQGLVRGRKGIYGENDKSGQG